MGKHSGRHAFKDKLSDLGYAGVTDDVIQTALENLKFWLIKRNTFTMKI